MRSSTSPPPTAPAVARDPAGPAASPPFDYFSHRVKQMGLSPADVIRYGIHPDPGGTPVYEKSDRGEVVPVTHFNAGTGQHEQVYSRPGGIQLRTFRMDGQRLMCVPPWRMEADKKARRRGSAREAHEAHNYHQYTRVRLHPDHVRPGGAKYIGWAGVSVPFFPMPRARDYFRRSVTGKPLYFIEGELKAVTMDRAGAAVVGFGGIGTYKLDPELREYIDRCRPPVVYIGYDADGAGARADDRGRITDRRPRGFLGSAVNLTGQVLDYCADIDHPVQIRLLAPHPDREECKGVDDLLLHPDTNYQVAARELREGVHGANWQVINLHPRRYDRQLRDWLYLGTVGQFYAAHQRLIGADPFSFGGHEYQRWGASMIMLSDPHRSEPKQVIELAVDRYLGEVAEHLDRLREFHRGLAVAAPTGSGKNTYIIDHARRTGQRIVLVVPLRSMARQFEGVADVAMWGSGWAGRAADIAGAQIVVCTAETIIHVPDIEQRTVVIDEAHALISQYGSTDNMFRGVAMRRVLEIAKRAAGMLLLSGTMPTALANELDLPLVRVSRQQSPQVRLHGLPTRNTKAAAATEALVASLTAYYRDTEQSGGKVSFVFFQNKRQGKLLRRALVAAGVLGREEIACVNSDTVKEGEQSVLGDITALGEVRGGTRLVICTSMLAEGININNTNVGRVYCAGTRDPDQLRQFIARFRKMLVLDVWLATPPEGPLDHRFRLPAAARIRAGIARAEALAPAVEDMLQPYGCTGPYGRGDFNEPLYRDAFGQLVPDLLAILAEEKNRQTAYAPPSYVLGRLLEYGGFVLADAEVTAEEEEDIPAATAAAEETTAAELDALAALEQIRAAEQLAKQTYLAELRDELAEAPAPALAVLHKHYLDGGNRGAAAGLQRLAGDAIRRVEEPDLLAASARLAEGLRLHRSARELVRRTAKLCFAGVEDVAGRLRMPVAEFRLWWSRVRSHYRAQDVAINPGALKAMKDGEVFGALARPAIIEAVEQAVRATAGGSVTDGQLLEAVRVRFIGVDRRTRIARVLIDLDRAKVRAMVEELYHVEFTRRARCWAVQIGPRWADTAPGDAVAPICRALAANPSKIRALTG